MSKAVGDLTLDSNAVIAYLAGESNAAAWIENATGLYLPVICVGELRYGALHGANPTKRTEEFERFSLQCTVLLADPGGALRYAEIRHELALKGTPIPEADLWIAAIAQAHGYSTLLSDDKHFDQVRGLVRHTWKANPLRRRKRR